MNHGWDNVLTSIGKEAGNLVNLARPITSNVWRTKLALAAGAPTSSRDRSNRLALAQQCDKLLDAPVVAPTPFIASRYISKWPCRRP
jgi:hypothetical protein